MLDLIASTLPSWSWKRRRSSGLPHTYPAPSAEYAPIPDANEDGSVPVAPSPVTIDALTRWTFFVLGCAILLPWNALIVAIPYFTSVLSHSSHSRTLASTLSTAFTLSNLLFLLHATSTAPHSNPRRRVTLALGLTALPLLLFGLSTLGSPSEEDKDGGGVGVAWYYAFLVVNTAACAAAGSYLQSAGVGLASLFGQGAMQAVFSGQGAIAVLISLLQLITSLASAHSTSPSRPADLGPGTLAFFLLSALFLIGALALFVRLVCSPAYAAAVSSADADAAHKRGDVSVWEVNRKVWKYGLAVMLVFVVTLSVFPPITSRIRSTHPPPQPLLLTPALFPALHFLLFNIFDLLGRSLPSLPLFFRPSHRLLLAVSLTRTLFIPLFLSCNISSSSSPPLINSDAAYLAILALFGVSNGWASTMGMIAGSSAEFNLEGGLRPEERDTAASVLLFWLTAGLGLGSVASFGVGWAAPPA